MYRWNRKCNIVVWLICLFVLTGCTSKEELIQLNQPEQLVEEASVESVGQPELETQEQEQREKEPGRNPDGEQQTMVAEREEAALAPQKEQKIYVHVCGAVANPGVYEMTSVSRIFEAVEAAGGFTDEADGDYVIQAEMLAEDPDSHQSPDGRVDCGWRHSDAAGGGFSGKSRGREQYHTGHGAAEGQH